ncbi:MAG: heat-inducible transcriptional repressor HrcA [Oscillospiraceae bacterium]|nr:heat-inducible transcriptional repressor HrcA [Oscillospiraceae bacterium]
MKLDERKKKVLAAIVEGYINNSKPVGSDYIAKLFENSVSSATIRSEMAFLYEVGLLEQPHTSAGRIPSLNGYRFYTENILQNCGIDDIAKDKITYLLEDSPNQKACLIKACSILAEISRCVVVFSSPHSETEKVQHMEVVRTSSDFCVVVLATSSGTVRHKICRFDHTISDGFLRGLNTFLNNTFANRFLRDVTDAFVNSIIATAPAEYSSFNAILSPILLCVYQICLESCNVDLYTKGRTNLLLYEELGKDAWRVLDLLENPQKVLDLMTAEPDQLEIRVGQNIGGSELRPFSVLDACYIIKDLGTGRIAMIGPVRIEYPVCVAYLKYFTEILPTYLKRKD